MSWLSVIVLGATGVAAMRAALDHGDLEEAARQGALAGPVVVEEALGATDRMTQLAAIAAAPLVEDRAELLVALARVAGGADRRTAIPAASAARTIARELARQDRPDDIAEGDVATWRAAWAELALRGDRWIELRIAALDTAAALDPAGIGVDLAAALHDPDPAFRRAAASIVSVPAPVASHAALASAVISDSDPDVALCAAQSLCLSVDPMGAHRLDGKAALPPHGSASLSDPAAGPSSILDLLGAAGLARLRVLVTDQRPAVATAVRDAARCLAADGSPESATVLRALRPGPPSRSRPRGSGSSR